MKLNYAVKKEKFSDDGQIDRKVEITFSDINNANIKVKYHSMLKEELYELIHKGEDLILDNAYISGFSLTEYRKLHGLSEIEYIPLKNFSAKNAFFESNHDVDFSFASFEGKDVNFAGSNFGKGNVSFNKARFGNVNVHFNNVTFDYGNVDFQFAEIGKGNISFENATFRRGDIIFVNTSFGDGKVNFKNGNGKTNFHYSHFGKGDITFEKALFGEGLIDFRKVDFGQGKVDFRRVNFGHGEVFFDEAEFKGGKTSFRSAIFGNGEVSFEMTNFGEDEASFEKVDFGNGNVSFRNVKAGMLIFKSCHLNNYLDLRVEKCKEIDLSDTIVRDIIDFRPIDQPVKISTLKFSGMRNLGRIFLDWKENNALEMIASQTDTSLYDKAEQFRILKEDFRNNGQYNEEDKAYIWFKRFEQKAELEEALKGNKLNALWAWPVYFLKSLIFDKMGQYATNPIRVLRSMFIVYTAYSILIYLMEILGLGQIWTGLAPEDQAGMLWRAFYYCGITFLTVGYGEYVPLGNIQWLAILIAFSGVFLMSYFTVAFVRKILR